jgi:TatD DNase family protein
MQHLEFIDSHCHLYLPQFKGEVEKVVQRAKDANISRMLVVGIEFRSFPDMLAMANKYPFMSASVGVHPSYRLASVPSASDFAARYQKLILANPGKIVAIGEMGLDYYRQYDKEYQHSLFRNQLLAAVELSLPVIIHTRNAREDTLSILRECHAERIGGVIHCFSEDIHFAKAVLDLNFMLSFSGIVTMAGHPEIQDVVGKVPDDRYLIETDSPYLTPHPKNNRKRNEPAFVVEIAAKVAEVKGVSIEKVAADSTRNFKTLFGAGVQQSV